MRGTNLLTCADVPSPLSLLVVAAWGNHMRHTMTINVKITFGTPDRQAGTREPERTWETRFASRRRLRFSIAHTEHTSRASAAESHAKWMAGCFDRGASHSGQRFTCDTYGFAKRLRVRWLWWIRVSMTISAISLKRPAVGPVRAETLGRSSNVDGRGWMAIVRGDLSLSRDRDSALRALVRARKREKNRATSTELSRLSRLPWKTRKAIG